MGNNKLTFACGFYFRHVSRSLISRRLNAVKVACKFNVCEWQVYLILMYTARPTQIEYQHKLSFYISLCGIFYISSSESRQSTDFSYLGNNNLMGFYFMKVICLLGLNFLIKWQSPLHQKCWRHLMCLLVYSFLTHFSPVLHFYTP